MGSRSNRVNGVTHSNAGRAGTSHAVLPAAIPRAHEPCEVSWLTKASVEPAGGVRRDRFEPIEGEECKLNVLDLPGEQVLDLEPPAEGYRRALEASDG